MKINPWCSGFSGTWSYSAFVSLVESPVISGGSQHQLVICFLYCDLSHANSVAAQCVTPGTGSLHFSQPGNP